MKTKYSDIVKIRKQKLTEIELQIVEAQNRKRDIEKEIETLKQELKEIVFPQSGTMATFNIAHREVEFLDRRKKELTGKLEEVSKLIEELEFQYKNSSIEYEKILHLHELEISKEKKRLLKEESKNFDEIANILFINNKESV